MRTVAEALERLLGALDRQEIRHMLGGSLASSIHGIQRFTREIDIVAAIGVEHTVALAEDLGRDFYMDTEAASDALRRGRPFNMIHLASSYKFDIFPVRDDPYSRLQLARSEVKPIAFGEGITVECPVATAEDTILAKLAWYRLGGEQSDQQWNDLRGVRSVQGNRLDRSYLDTWAKTRRVDDLLQRLLNEETP
jgi:hypothetical protein